MQQLSFLFIFIVLLGLVLFSMQNTDLATIIITNSIKLEAPIAIELILAMGVGAVLAWIFSVWAGLQESVSTGSKNRQIKSLQKQLAELAVQVEKQEEAQQLMVEGAIDVEVEEKSKA